MLHLRILQKQPLIFSKPETISESMLVFYNKKRDNLVKPEFNKHRSKETDHLHKRVDVQAGKVTRRDFTKASLNNIPKERTREVKKDAVEGAIDTIEKHLRQQGKLIESTSQKQHHEKFGRNYESFLKEEIRQKEIKDIIQKRSDEIRRAAGPDSNNDLLKSYHIQGIKLLDLPKYTTESSFIAEKSQSVPISDEVVQHINTIYGSAFNQGFNKFYQANNQDFISASAHAHQVAFELIHHRTREIAFYEKIGSFTKLEVRKLKKEFDKQRRALEKIIDTPDIEELIEEASDILSPKAHLDLITKHKKLYFQDKGDSTNPHIKLEQRDKLTEDFISAIKGAREREQDVEQSIAQIGNESDREKALEYNREVKLSKTWFNKILKKLDNQNSTVVGESHEEYANLAKKFDDEFKQFQQTIMSHKMMESMINRVKVTRIEDTLFQKLNDKSFYEEVQAITQKIKIAEGYIWATYNNHDESSQVRSIIEEQGTHQLPKSIFQRKCVLRSLGNKATLEEFKNLQIQYFAIARRVAEHLNNQSAVAEFTVNSEAHQQN